VIYQLSVYLHILSAIVWVGGMLFLALVVVPATRAMDPAERGALISALGRRFRVIGWLCIVLLLATGAVNAGYRGVTLGGLFTAPFLESAFGRTLLAKLALVALLILLSVLHDFVIGPRWSRAQRQRDPEAQRLAARLRRRASALGRLNTLLALLIVALAVLLVRPLG
jgi:putative copper resistance protein D